MRSRAARMSASGERFLMSRRGNRELWGVWREDLQSMVTRFPCLVWHTASTDMAPQAARKQGIRRLMHSAANRYSVR